MEWRCCCLVWPAGTNPAQKGGAAEAAVLVEIKCAPRRRRRRRCLGSPSFTATLFAHTHAPRPFNRRHGANATYPHSVAALGGGAVSGSALAAASYLSTNERAREARPSASNATPAR